MRYLLRRGLEQEPIGDTKADDAPQAGYVLVPDFCCERGVADCTVQGNGFEYTQALERAQIAGPVVLMITFL